jgi:type IV pilus assembly protein PilM
VSLVVPDTIARVSLVRFESVPARAGDLDELIRWQVKKTTPFPLDDAVIGYTPGLSTPGAHEFVVTVARRDVIQQYERACELAGAHAGIVDLATFNVVNAVLAPAGAVTGDWLLVHAAPSYVSLAVLRDGHLIFYRTRGEESEGSVADLVHQTAMYYEDRLQGQRFSRVLLSGGSTVAGADHLRRELSERLGLDVVAVDPFHAASPAARLGASPSLADALAPGIGILLRERAAS